MRPFKKKVAFKEHDLSEISGDRRSKSRYPLDLPVHYKMVKDSLVTAIGICQTLDMSSSGIAFTADKTFKRGTHIQLSIRWPVLLNGACALNLVAEGPVVHSDGRFTAIRMDRHEFRTKGRSTIQPVAKLAMEAGF